MNDADRVPGMNTARILFDRGLWFDGVVRGLVAEVGLTTEEATLAAIAVTRERFARADGQPAEASASG